MIVVLAAQGIKGMSKAVMMRSLLDSRILVAMMAGTLQPNPRMKSGTDLPWSPIRCMKASIKKPALAR